MKSYLRSSATVFLALIFVCVTANAQNDTISAAAGDKFIISVKAGAVNFVQGTVTVARKNGTSGLLLKRDALEVGDRVSTAADGKVEILLNPGSFLRLGGNSSFEFKTTTLDDLELKIFSGSAIFEVYAADEFKVIVGTPTATYSLVKSGVFRIDVPANGDSRLRVWKGMATVGVAYEVKPGRSALASGKDDVSLAKFDRDEMDELDVWSKARSKELARLTASLKRQDVRSPLMSGFWGGAWNFWGSFGLWLYSPSWGGGYCFMPFGSGWHSPYGYGYGGGMGWWWTKNLPVNMPTTGPVGANGAKPTTSMSIPMPVKSSPIPPFIRMELMSSGGGVPSAGGGGGHSDSGSSYSPSYDSSTGSRSSSSSSSSSSGSSSSSATSAKDSNTGSRP